MELKNFEHDDRPWGYYDRYTLNEQTSVKIIKAEPNQALSLQYHHKREEFWKILSGKGEVVIDDKTIEAKEGDEFFIPKKAKHRITTQDSSIMWLEISFGEFDEDDIVRLEDKYNRK
jgi:mannose-6-phosphate isomerase-like protein (cupin superfamily)